jgi:hypothetical protein
MTINIKPGDSFITFDTNDPDSIKEHKAKIVSKRIITGTGKDEFYHPTFCFPLEMKDELKAILVIRAKLKKDYDDSISLVYQLINKYSK